MKRLVWAAAIAACGGTKTAAPSQRPPAQDTGDREAAMWNGLRARMQSDPIGLIRDLGVADSDFEALAKQLYFEWRKKYDHPRANAGQQKTPAAGADKKTPASFVDENGVTVLFNDHRWFCFEAGDTGVTMCAVTPAECIEFAEALKSAPTCGVREAATCITYERNGRTSGKCFGSPKECQTFYPVFIDEQTKITSACMTLRYRGF